MKIALVIVAMISPWPLANTVTPVNIRVNAEVTYGNLNECLIAKGKVISAWLTEIHEKDVVDNKLTASYEEFSGNEKLEYAALSDADKASFREIFDPVDKLGVIADPSPYPQSLRKAIEARNNHVGAFTAKGQTKALLGMAFPKTLCIPIEG